MLFISIHWLCESCAQECLGLVDRKAGCRRGGAICKQFKSVPIKKNISSYFPDWPPINQGWPGDFHGQDRSSGSSLYPQTLFLNSFEQALKAITHTGAEVLRGQLHATVYLVFRMSLCHHEGTECLRNLQAPSKKWPKKCGDFTSSWKN